jgi:uncharacterized protein YqjF (DUF2071 family)
MVHSWRNLTFLHWAVPAEQLQRLLPKGLTVDTYEGRAYVGLVPFTMQGIRLSWLPPVPGLDRSHETNVRTYVVDERGVPGVWFFSLDAANPVFVHTARVWYRLNYVRSQMSMVVTDGRATYGSRRRWPRVGSAECRVEVYCPGTPVEAEPGTLEFFLVERYVLFAQSPRGIYEGRVWHAPYKVTGGEVVNVQETMLEAAQIARPAGEPHVLYSPGVDVQVYKLRPTGV